MGADMRVGLYDDSAFGKLALQMLGDVPMNFRLYEAGRVPEPPKEWTHMEVSGAEFRETKSGPDKGKLNVMVPGTSRTVLVPRPDIDRFNRNAKSPNQGFFVDWNGDTRRIADLGGAYSCSDIKQIGAAQSVEISDSSGGVIFEAVYYPTLQAIEDAGVSVHLID